MFYVVEVGDIAFNVRNQVYKSVHLNIYTSLYTSLAIITIHVET